MISFTVELKWNIYVERRWEFLTLIVDEHQVELVKYKKKWIRNPILHLVEYKNYIRF